MTKVIRIISFEPNAERPQLKSFHQPSVKSLNKSKINKNYEWHILEGNNQKILSRWLNRKRKDFYILISSWNYGKSEVSDPITPWR